MSTNTILKVFPDTGHQYFSIPFTDLFHAPKDWQGLMKLVDESLYSTWQPWSRRFDWIRWKYDYVDREADDRDKVPMLRLAIETNMANPEEGMVLSASEIEGQMPTDEQAPEMEYFACPDQADIERRMSDRRVPLKGLPGMPNPNLKNQIVVEFREPKGFKPVYVDLVVDLGNTRTAALLLESRGRENADRQPFSRRVHALRLGPPGWEFGHYHKDEEDAGDLSSCIIPSWFMVARPIFSAFEPPWKKDRIISVTERTVDPKVVVKKEVLPRQFVELSPALIGGGSHPDGASRKMIDLNLAGEVSLFSLSSPKLYTFSEIPVGSDQDTFWSQVRNPADLSDWNADEPFDSRLKGLFRHFMDPSGLDMNEELDPDKRFQRFVDQPASYPRRDSVCWFALALIEAAYRQINSSNYIDTIGDESSGLPRRLRHVMVTFPTAWTEELRTKYFAQWQRAIDLFTAAHFPPDQWGSSPKEEGLRPELVRDAISESICSQFPILFSDIRSLQNELGQWLDLFGTGDQLVVMNLDIGGGTTDVTVIEYTRETGERETLKPRLLFRDGSHIAGDLLVKSLVEKVLLPAWWEASDPRVKAAFPNAAASLSALLAKPYSMERKLNKPGKRLERLTRLLFGPLMCRLLGYMSNSDSKYAQRTIHLNLDDERLIDRKLLHDFNDLAAGALKLTSRDGDLGGRKVFAETGDISIKVADVEQCIEEVFGRFLKYLARFAGHFNCHLAVVTGKPSELPMIRRMIERYFPILPQRILHAKNFPVGDWYPLETFQIQKADEVTRPRILDAKMSTVIGAALYVDSRYNRVLTDFVEIDEFENELSKRCFWGEVRRDASYERFFEPKTEVEPGQEVLADTGDLLFSPADYNDATDERDENGQLTGRIVTQKTFRLKVNNCRIGRHIFRAPEVPPDAVYDLRLLPEKGSVKFETREVIADVTLRWASEPGKGEKLEFVEAKNFENGFELGMNRVALVLDTLPQGFWVDNPSFNVDFPQYEED